MKQEENDILRGLKKKRDILCNELGIDAKNVENSFLNRTEEEMNTEKIADLTRQILRFLAKTDVTDKVVILWLEDFLRDLEIKKLDDPLATLRINALLSESDDFGI